MPTHSPDTSIQTPCPLTPPTHRGVEQAHLNRLHERKVAHCRAELDGALAPAEGGHPHDDRKRGRHRLREAPARPRRGLMSTAADHTWRGGAAPRHCRPPPSHGAAPRHATHDPVNSTAAQPIHDVRALLDARAPGRRAHGSPECVSRATTQVTRDRHSRMHFDARHVSNLNRRARCAAPNTVLMSLGLGKSLLMIEPTADERVGGVALAAGAARRVCCSHNTGHRVCASSVGPAVVLCQWETGEASCITCASVRWRAVCARARARVTAGAAAGGGV